MSYIACAHCGNLNRQADEHCYSCGQELVAAPPPPPPSEAAPATEDDPWAANKDIRVQPLSPQSGSDPSKARFKDLASRYDVKAVRSIDSNALHGIRSGIPAGLLTGLLMGFYRKGQSDDLTRILVRKYNIPRHGSEIMGYSMAFDLFFGLLLGIFLGLTNLLCFTPESARTGAIVGALVGGGLLFFAGSSGYVGILLGAVHGLVLGTLISLIERKLFRRG